ncbi:hypothetical protein R84865_001562 [Carnimonas sp. R-84865]
MLRFMCTFMRKTPVTLSCLPMLLVTLSSAIASNQINWTSRATQDLHFIHDYVRANHPGMVNEEDPEFGPREFEAFRLALAQASDIRSYAGYFWLIERYRAHFNDLHMQISPTSKAPSIERRWPGFLTRMTADGTQRVVASEPGAKIPLNATLVSCDGIKAQTLMQTNVGSFTPSWFLKSQRLAMGYRLFIDEGNPFIRRPALCLFDVEGKELKVKLDWHSVSPDRMKQYISQAQRSFDQPTALHHLPDDSWWLSLPSFDSFASDDKLQPALTAVLKQFKAALPAIQHSKGLTIDLRGNYGGNSDWANQLATILWGEQGVTRLLQEETIDWRASSGVLEELRQRALYKGLPPPLREEMQDTAIAIAKARQHDQPLWNEPSKMEAHRHKVIPLRVPILLVTDESCLSACLDAVDLFRKAGAIQVGRETSADTFYMDNNFVFVPETPSHLTRISIPMKIYRHRFRGSNQPSRPLLEYQGDISSTQDVKAWVSLIRSVVTGLD